ncbi:MAG: tRNA dihydrouridine synthase DusB [Endomicrobium sp.]|jgi:tRNA-dihydrouridine synthase B|nr:tRNA dihydrouridine synthase DusB [Endomicrobium sp.]
MNKLTIGNIKFCSNIFLAPMAGTTDLPLRLLAKEGGAGLVYTEMVSAKALVYHDEKTRSLLRIRDQERPVAAQIFGGEVSSMSEAARIVQDIGVDIIDINLGCPVRKVAKAGAGARLLANEHLVAKILESVVDNVNIPVTIKIRIGLLPGQNVAKEIIHIAHNSGIKMVVVHARYASLGHSGKPDLEAFAESCSDAKIPIIANGGIVDEKTAQEFMKIPNCSGLMVGRGAIGNYSIFKRLESFIAYGKTLPKAGKEEKVQWLRKHVQYSIDNYGIKKGLVVFRKVAHYYIKDFPNASKIRCMINTMSNLDDFNTMLKTLEALLYRED